MENKLVSIIIASLLIIILGLSVYGNSLNNKFIWDDYFLVKDNPQVKNWSYLPQIFTGDVGSGIGIRYGFYRPLATLTYLFNYSFWGLDLKAFHLTNIILHLLVALAVFWLAGILSHCYLFSLLAGLLFVCHPIHTEAITYISGRSDPLSALFFLLCLIFYIKQLSSGGAFQFVVMLLSYALALLSRENSLVLPALLLLYHYAFKVEFKKKPFFSLLTLSLIYLITRTTLLKSSLPIIDARAQSWFLRMPGFFAAIADYLKILVLPFNLHMEYGNRFFSIFDIKTVIGFLAASSTLIYAFVKRNNSKMLFFAILWFFIALLAVSNIYPVGAYMAEHWLYLPSIGFFFVLAYALNLLFEKKPLRFLAAFFIVILTVFYSYLTLRQNEYWREPVTFYQRTLRYAYDPAKIYFNLGNTYYNQGKKDEAVYSYKKAIKINPIYDKAYVNLGNAYEDSGRIEEAIAAYKKALKVSPGFPAAYYNLGCAYANSGRNEEAIEAFKNTLEADTNYSPAHYSLLLLYFFKKDYASALRHCNKAVKFGYKIDPEFLKLLIDFNN